MSEVSRHQITVGEVIVTEDECVIATILGSCVSVGIYTGGGVGGLIHFALPRAPEAFRDEDAFRYGDQAVPALIDEVCRVSGLRPSDLSAKIVGGAVAGLSGEAAATRAAGPGNVEFARRALGAAGVKIVSEATGGHRGRRILFHPASGRMQVAEMNAAPAEDIDPRARRGGDGRTERTVAPARPTHAGRRRVLIVDDSKTIRDLLTRVLSEDPELEIIGQAADALEAERMLATLKPDVITLDINMPHLSGVQWLERLLPRRPIPVVMISSLQMQEGNEVFRSLELGAVDYIQKPTLAELPVIGPLIREKVRAAADARVILPTAARGPSVLTGESLDPRAVLCIGASTGGTEAIKAVMCAMPARIPPVLIVQHIPPVFSKTFADRLNELCPFEVKEAEDGDEIRASRVLIAPGGRQMRVEAFSGGYRVRVTDDAPVNRHKPSVEYLFNSVASVIKNRGAAVILTGMGGDGAKGLLNLREAGWRTFGQNEQTCVVYGMPKVAFEIGAVETVVPLGAVAGALLSSVSLRKLA